MRHLLSALALSALLLPAARAGTLFVDAALASGSNDGSSWVNAFQGPDGLQAALAAASSGDQIFVADGSYRATSTGSRSISFALKDGVALFGGFLGGESDPSQRPPFWTAPSVLDGDLAGDDGLGQFGDNTFHLVNAAGTTASAVLDGFVIRSGAATGSGGNNDRGGGILCVGAVSPTIRNCRFVANRCTFGGAAGYINNSGAPSFTDCSFEDGNGGSFGGAFDVAGGGAVRLQRCRFTGNTAARAGAVELFTTTGAIVSDCVFLGNISTGTGGGGGMWLGSGGNPVIRNCTIAGNSSTTNAVAGLRVQNAANATIANCILWDNSGPGGAQDSGNQVNANADVSFSIVEGGFVGGTGNLGSDPLLANLAGGDVTLGAASPAIDAGSNSAVPAGVTLDLLGHPRFADVLGVADTGEGSAPIVDIGALEAPSVWLDLDHALAGAGGAPQLLLSGTLEANSSVNVALSGAATASTAWFVLGVTLLSAPFKGGVMVPDVDVLAPFPTGAAGAVNFAFAWPVGVPTGFPFWTQFWVQDAGGPKGFAASNAVQGTSP
jgi:hypothetical protein